MLRFLTAGESHGKALVAILDGMPAGLALDFDAITAELRRRQGGYGRGRRMAIESDKAEALSGVRHGVTTGAPIALMIPNKDWENWQKTMHVEPAQPEGATGADRPAVTRPAPGPRRSGRRREVRARRHPQRARTRQRARDRRPRRRRFASRGSCWPRSAPHRQPCLRDRPRLARRSAEHHVRTGARHQRRTRRSTAPIRRSSSR